MTRFDAATPADRGSLVADAIEAHRDRGSVFCTLEADAPPGGQVEAPDVDAVESDEEGEAADELGAPAWIQFSDPESQLNLDCTDEEYDRITSVLTDASAFTVGEQSSPEDADGRNLRITAYADPERIGEIVDRIFVEGYDYDENYRLWATEI